MKQYLISAVLLVLGFAITADAQDGAAAQVMVQPPTVTNAMDGIFAAFRNHPLVGMGDNHRLAQQLDFYAALVRDPRFAKEVGNVVVEFGGAAHQDIIDRYVSGQPVPYSELRKVWLDTVGWIPSVPALGYVHFYAQVRAVNQTLPRNQQIHVWLGEPEIDWSKIQTHGEWQALDAFRDSHPAELIIKNILQEHKKALVIYGTSHFGSPVRDELMAKLDSAGWRPYHLKVLVEKSYPGALFVVTPYSGFVQKSCSTDFEQRSHNWPIPALVAPIRGTDIENELRGSSSCFVVAPNEFRFPPIMTESERAEILPAWMDDASGVGSDALLYLGPSSSLTISPDIPDNYLDSDYRQDMAKHYLLQTEQTLPAPKIENHPVAPQPWRP